MSLRHLLSPLVRVEPVWRFLDATVLRPGRVLDLMRKEFVEAKQEDEERALTARALEVLCPDQRVRHGLLAGLRFPHFRMTYGALGAKLFGSYERELHPALGDLCATRGYGLVVDVGCAEGYYAVGLARLMPNVRVRAFDTDYPAITFCREMAEENGVADRVTVGGFCDHRTLLQEVRDEPRALIVSDCEGYEVSLFPQGAGEALRRHDIVIEVHDFVDITVSTHLREVFGDSHDIELVRSEDDLDKVRTYHEIYPELDQFDLPTRRLLTSEGRRAIQQWFVVRSREPLP
jgi:hypothetical protein